MAWLLPKKDTYFRLIFDQDPRGFQIGHLEEALRFVKRHRRAIDGGAHVGTWAFRMADYFEHVWAFEPAPDSFECLIHNTASKHHIYCINAALGAEFTQANIVDDLKRVGNTGARYIAPVDDPDETQVYVDTIDGYDLDDLDFLKLDLEGYETFALEGARETIARCQPVIMVECKEFDPPRNGGVTATIAFLTKLGYGMAGGLGNDKVFVPR